MSKRLTDRQAVYDILEQILDIKPVVTFRPHSWDKESTCPFCKEKVCWVEEDMSRIIHLKTCAYKQAFKRINDFM